MLNNKFNTDQEYYSFFFSLSPDARAIFDQVFDMTGRPLTEDTARSLLRHFNILFKDKPLEKACSIFVELAPEHKGCTPAQILSVLERWNAYYFFK